SDIDERGSAAKPARGKPASPMATATTASSSSAGEPPLYQQVKDYIVGRILAGDWPEGTRVPSENVLTREQAVSRMTVHRALRELTSEGWLERVQGAGTFVDAPKPQSEVLAIRNIAEEIAARGHAHRAEV